MSMEVETSTTPLMADETDAQVTSGWAPVPGVPATMKPGRVPIKSWVIDHEGSALVQATNLSNLPFAVRHVALMPDAHTGYGMPIGGVLFADGAVVPYAIGVDIGCGVALVETDLMSRRSALPA
jgi:RNA-splicing ligase RtcB